MAEAETMSLWRRRYHRKGVFYVLPAVCLFLLMGFYPILRSFTLSFFDYSILAPDAAKFVLFDNYKKIFTESRNLQSFVNTVRFAVMFVPFDVTLSLFVAILLNRIRRGSVFLRTMIFTPIVVSAAVSSVMWLLFYDVTFGAAQHLILSFAKSVNGIAAWFGAESVMSLPDKGVLASTAWAMPAVVLMCVWNGLGFNIILYLVGLQRIPDELYEAAVVDGATPWQQFCRITLPQLSPTIFLVVLLSAVNAFKVFAQPFILTGGGPQDSTLTYIMRLYFLAFRYGKFQLGYASAMGYTLAVFIFFMSLAIRRLNKPVD